MAEPCTEDMEPFMKTCRALCMVLWPSTAVPVSASVKPAGQGQKGDHSQVSVISFPGMNEWSRKETFDGVPEAPVGEAIHGPGLVLGEAQDKFHVGRRWESARAVGVVISRVTQQRPLAGGVAQHLSVVVLLWLGADHLGAEHTHTHTVHGWF